MALDKSKIPAASVTVPALEAFEVTPGNSDLAAYTRALYVGGTGDLLVKMAGGSEEVVTFANVPAGSVLPIVVSQVQEGTTATNIVAIY